MKVKVEKGGPCRKILVVEVPAEEVDAEYAKVRDDFARVARIPGFRQGRAPVKLVESRFAREIREEIRDRLVGRSYPEALKQAQLKPLMILDLKAEAEPKKPMVYSLTLDVSPEFKLPKYKHISITQKSLEVKDEDVQKAFASYLERFATTVPVSGRPAARGDLLQVDYERKNGGEKARDGKNSDPLSGGRNFWMLLGDNEDLLPGFSDALIGMAAGERKEFSLKLPADFRVKNLAGAEVAYNVCVKAVRERKVPELNEEFFKATGVQSEADLREKIKAAMQEEGKRLEKRRQQDEIVAYLLERTSVDLPESVVRDETQHMYLSMVREHIMRGGAREQIASQREEFLSVAAKTAADRVKLGYILHEIGEAEKIAVGEDEVEKEIQKLSLRYRTPVDELKKEFEEKKEINSIRHELKMAKILDFLHENAEVGSGEKGIISRLFKGGESKPGA